MTTLAPVVGVALVVATGLSARAALEAGRRHAVRCRLETPSAGPTTSLPPAPIWFARALDEAGSDHPAAGVWWAWMGALAMVTAGALAVAGPALALVGAGASVVAPAVVLRARRGQGNARLEQGLPTALEAVARSLRSGASLRQAIAEAAVATPGRLGRELAQVARQVSEGATLAAGLEGLAARRPLPGIRLAVAALCLGVETGGARARAVDGVAATLRDRLAVAGELRALSSQARISALVIGVAPLAFGAFALTTDPRTADFLFHTPAGLGLLVVGVLLDGLGWLWMQRLTRVAV